MESLKIKGIVVRQAPLGDNDKMLTVLTAEKGAVSVCARGVKSLKNKNAQAVMPLCYSEYVLTKKGDVFSLVSADIIESFYALREDVKALSYAVYFAHLALFFVGADTPALHEMRLLLNTLYLLSKSPERCSVLKCVFELKLCEYAGIAPYVEHCACGEEGEFFDISEGETVCLLHKSRFSKKISENAKTVCRYIQNANLKAALTFNTSEETAEELSCLVEEFMEHQMGKLPKSLEYINKII